jgi:hypothetical protein
MEIRIDLYGDWIEMLKSDLIANGYSISSDSTPDNICHRYFNVKRRLIEPVPRSILLSSEFTCPQEQLAGLDLVKKKIASGEDLKPHLSEQINNTDYDDGMLNDWGIYHLHLGILLQNNGFIERTGPLLYARFTHDSAYLINIYPHGKWALQDLMKIVHHNWPELLLPYSLKQDGLISLGHSPIDSDIKAFRKNTINALIQMEDGTVYFPPGGGVATSKLSRKSTGGVSSDVLTKCNHMYRRLNDMEKLFFENINLISDEAKRKGCSEENILKFKLVFDGLNAFAFDEQVGISVDLGLVL